ncbi:hypothetical protein [Acrocarpospora sp. B8E8]|uniref:hypothetical protein n=1 Tax=Acrocarpospora sp. B8E8 TaxID=3153572 RepID=UPI00325E58F5
MPQAERSARIAEEDSPAEAAATALFLAASTGTGRYLEDGAEVPPSPQAMDPRLAAWLWERCSELTGLPTGMATIRR